jgi:uncharacterized membrane protein
MPDPHPFLVHFPIALLIASFIFEIWGMYRRSPELGRAAWWTQLLGTIGVVLAVVSGLAAANDLQPAKGAQGALDLHHQMTFASSSLLWRISAKTEVPPRNRTAYLLLLCLGVVLLLIGSCSGGVLVFEHGVGVNG